MDAIIPIVPLIAPSMIMQPTPLRATIIQNVLKCIPAALLDTGRPGKECAVLLDASGGLVEVGVAADVLARGVHLSTRRGGSYTAETAVVKC